MIKWFRNVWFLAIVVLTVAAGLLPFAGTALGRRGLLGGTSEDNLTAMLDSEAYNLVTDIKYLVDPNTTDCLVADGSEVRVIVKVEITKSEMGEVVFNYENEFTGSSYLSHPGLTGAFHDFFVDGLAPDLHRALADSGLSARVMDATMANILYKASGIVGFYCGSEKGAAFMQDLRVALFGP